MSTLKKITLIGILYNFGFITGFSAGLLYPSLLGFIPILIGGIISCIFFVSFIKKFSKDKTGVSK